MQQLLSHRGPLIVPMLAVTEGGYLVGTRPGVDAEVRFPGDLAAGGLWVEPVAPGDGARIAELVGRHRDLPLGAVHASSVAAADRLAITGIATLDRRHFSFVRPAHTGAFQLLP